MKAPELPALTGIRFFAALAVFLSHVSNLPGKSWFAPDFEMGNFGVAVFFVLSGFILTYNYARYFGGEVSIENYRRFLWDRLAKIYPLYLLTLLLAIPIELVGHHRVWSWSALIMQLTLVQSILPVDKLNSTNHFNVPGWSISCEMFFYLLTPALIWLGFSNRRLVPTVVLGGLAATILTLVAGSFAPHISAWPARFAPARTGEFIVGVMTAICFLKGRTPKPFVIHVYTASGIILIILSLYAGSPLRCLSLGFLNAPGAALLIYGLAYGRGWLAQFLSHPWLILLGASSFAFYLIHDLVIRVFKGGLEHYHISINTTSSAAAMTIVLLVLIQILSIWLFKVVELPVQKYLRSLIRRGKPV